MKLLAKSSDILCWMNENGYSEATLRNLTRFMRAKEAVKFLYSLGLKEDCLRIVEGS